MQEDKYLRKTRVRGGRGHEDIVYPRCGFPGGLRVDLVALRDAQEQAPVGRSQAAGAVWAWVGGRGPLGGEQPGKAKSSRDISVLGGSLCGGETRTVHVLYFYGLAAIPGRLANW